MNPGGLTEETGSTARQLIQSLSSTPVILALVVFNVLYMAAGVYTQVLQGQRFSENQKHWEHVVEMTMQYCPNSGLKKEQ
jgi:hypothetical protein